MPPIHYGYDAQKPELIAVEAQLAHSTKKIKNAENVREQVTQDEMKQKDKVRKLQGELESVQRAADAAQGLFLISRDCFVHANVGHARGSEKTLAEQPVSKSGQP